MYEDFYEELDNRIRTESSMNMIFFGPPSSFLRLDSESILHILINTKKHLIPITRVLLAWDILTGYFHLNLLKPVNCEIDSPLFTLLLC